MNRIIRLYNQNRRAFWTIIAIIIAIFVVIQLFNYFSKIENQKNNNTIVEEQPYEEQSKSIISGEGVSKSNRNAYGELIETFLKNCINGEVDKAYNALSTQCKEELYPTVELFKNTYWNRNFSTKKTYTFQSWNSADIDTYIIKLYEDNLSTGAVNSGEYIEDYYTIIREDDSYKLNISNFIRKKEINKQTEKDGISITVENVKMYKEYYIYQVKIKNNADSNIIWDSRQNTGTVYVTNDNDINFDALLYENPESDFLLQAGEEKTTQIKYGLIFREDLKIESMSFTDIVNNFNGYDKRMTITVEL